MIFLQENLKLKYPSKIIFLFWKEDLKLQYLVLKCIYLMMIYETDLNLECKRRAFHQPRPVPQASVVSTIMKQELTWMQCTFSAKV